jgi:hypothetical protein
MLRGVEALAQAASLPVCLPSKAVQRGRISPWTWRVGGRKQRTCVAMVTPLY